MGWRFAYIELELGYLLKLLEFYHFMGFTLIWFVHIMLACVSISVCVVGIGFIACWFSLML